MGWLRAASLFEHMRHICERPRMFAPDFTLDHLHIFILGYEDALADTGLPSQSQRFDDWLYRRYPEWREKPEWWARQILHASAGELDKALTEIGRLVDLFLETEGAEFSHFPRPHHNQPFKLED